MEWKNQTLIKSSLTVEQNSGKKEQRKLEKTEFDII